MAATHARLSTFELPPENVDLSIKVAQEQVMPQLHAIKGFTGVIVLIDREAGKSVALTLWDSKDSMTASESDANKLRVTGADETGERVVSVDRYEIAIVEGVTL